MSDAAVAAKTAEPLIKDTQDGLVIHEVADIHTFTTAKCRQLGEEFVAHGLVTEIPGFAKKSLPDKRDALVLTLKSLMGEPEEAVTEEVAAQIEETLATEAPKPKKGKKQKA